MKKLFVLTTLLAALVFNLHAQTTWTGTNTTGNAYRTGNVGIGTTTPSERLDVTGNIKSNQYRFNIVNYDFSLPPRTQLLAGSIKLFDDYYTYRPGGTSPENCNYGTLLAIYGRSGHWQHDLYFGSNNKIYFRTGTYSSWMAEDGNLGGFSNWRVLLDSKSNIESAGNLLVNGQGPHYISQGNIGIGVTNPSSKLEIGAGGDISLKATANDAGDLVFKKGDQTQLARIWAAYDGNSGLYLSSGDITPDITISATGNVGIGVTSPTAGLHVTSRYDNNGTYISAILGNNYNDWTAFGSINGGKIRGSSEGYLVLESNANGTNKKVYINHDSDGDVSIANGGGKLGIGMTSPSAKLDILTNHTSQTPIRITHNNYNDWVLQKRRSDNTQMFGIKEENSNGSMGLATAGVTRMTILSGGNVGIGCTNPGATLTVNGNIQATRIDITATVPCSDFVFEEDYNLRSLTEVEAFVKENKHLPEVPSAAEFKENGYSVGEMDDILLRKVEELTLYIIEQQKLIEQLQEKVETLEGK